MTRPNADIPLETHPWEPFVPEGARVLIMGTFPPQPHRWAMDFYYPNLTNDFWRVMGIIFRHDPEAFYDRPKRTFRLDDIKALCRREGIALADTGHRVRRLAGNASDKFLEIAEPVDLRRLIDSIPTLTDIATTGQKAAEVVAAQTSTPVPALGQYVEGPRGIRIWRMPSTSRAYPLRPEVKAAHYSKLFAS